MKLVFVALFLGLFNAPSSFAQDPSDFQKNAEIENSIQDAERGVAEAYLQTGRWDEAQIKSYSELLHHAYDRPEEVEQRVNNFTDVLEAAALYQARDEIITEADLKAEPGLSGETESTVFETRERQMRARIECSPIALAIRSDVRDFGDGVRRQALNCVVPRDSSRKLKGQFYVMWGYNRTQFGRTDSTFKTPEGTFTIHDTYGKDRPSPFDFKVYFNPTELSIPQYNLTIGYQFNPRWAIEVGEDHMKWVFNNTRTYKFTGEFSPTLYVKDQSAPAGVNAVRPATFEEIKASGDATWLAFEHTNGYNYVFASASYSAPIAKNRKGTLGLEGRFGAGAGVFIPQTSVWMHRDAAWNWKGYDNQFHLAGGGGHLSTALRVTFFERVFFQATARGSLIKVTNALVAPSGAVLTQTPIGALELMGQLGYKATIGGRSLKGPKAYRVE